MRGDLGGLSHRPARLPDIHDPAKNRAARKLRGMGATAAQARRAFELAAASWRWDQSELDDYERENIDTSGAGARRRRERTRIQPHLGP